MTSRPPNWAVRRLSTIAVLFGLVFAAIAVVAVPAAAVPVITEAELRAAWAADAVVTLGASITLTDCSPSGGELLRSDPADLTVDGNGFTITQTCPGQRVAETAGGTLTLEDIAMTGGDLVDGTIHDVGGGAVKAGGALVATGVSIHDNAVTATAPGGTYASGGGLWAAGLLTLTQSTVSDNRVTVGVSPGIAAGGGVYTVGGTIDASTIAGNEIDGATAALGGGIEMASPFSAPLVGPLTISNSTISDNVATSPGDATFGGGMTTSTRVQLVYATFNGNSARTGASISADVTTVFRTGEVQATATVIATEPGVGNCFFPKGYSTSLRYSWVTDSSCGPPDATTIANGADPQLGALADNGGPTPTMLPSSTSPLLDAIPTDACRAGDASAITTDQRGVARPQGNGCDIGAVEVVVSAPASPPVSPTVPAPVVTGPVFTG